MMANFNDRLRAFSIQLFEIDAIKFGEFKTKIGLMTPVYCDLRIIVSYPKLLDTLAELIVEHVGHLDRFNIICGVPYTALPIATTISIKRNLPMVMRRKEAKDYGTKKLIEGKFNIGDNCLIVEDVVTSGSSVLETVKDLDNSGIKCTDCVVLLNREQGGATLLSQNGIEMHALLGLTQLMEYLLDANLIGLEMVEKVKKYLRETQVMNTTAISSPSPPPPHNRLKMPFSVRANFVTKNPLAVRIFKLIMEKKSTLCVAADLTSTEEILNLAEQVGPYVVFFKTHIDIIEDYHENFVKRLVQIAHSHNFILFEDRKFADIGKTVQLQYSKGVYQISQWAPLVTCHSLIGRGVLDAIEQIDDNNTQSERGVFLLGETSAASNLIDEKYTKATVKLAENYSNLVVGIVCQSPLFLDKPQFLQLTPGVQLNVVGDNLGQQYNSPEVAVLEKGADICVVGRGITQQNNPAEAAKQYRDLLWKAYCNRISDTL